MEMKWPVPEVCHVNGPSWFSGGTSLTRLTQYALFNTTIYVLYNTHLATVQYVIAYYTTRLCVLLRASLRIVQMSCSLCTCLSQWTMAHLSAGARY